MPCVEPLRAAVDPLSLLLARSTNLQTVRHGSGRALPVTAIKIEGPDDRDKACEAVRMTPRGSTMVLLPPGAQLGPDRVPLPGFVQHVPMLERSAPMSLLA